MQIFPTAYANIPKSVWFGLIQHQWPGMFAGHKNCGAYYKTRKMCVRLQGLPDVLTEPFQP